MNMTFLLYCFKTIGYSWKKLKFETLHHVFLIVFWWVQTIYCLKIEFFYLFYILEFLGSRSKELHKFWSLVLLICIQNHSWKRLWFPLDIVHSLILGCNLFGHFVGIKDHILYINIDIYFYFGMYYDT